jgi:hypothetical protein
MGLTPNKDCARLVADEAIGLVRRGNVAILNARPAAASVEGSVPAPSCALRDKRLRPRTRFHAEGAARDPGDEFIELLGSPV